MYYNWINGTCHHCACPHPENVMRSAGGMAACALIARAQHWGSVPRNKKSSRVSMLTWVIDQDRPGLLRYAATRSPSSMAIAPTVADKGLIAKGEPPIQLTCIDQIRVKVRLTSGLDGAGNIRLVHCSNVPRWRATYPYDTRRVPSLIRFADRVMV